MVRQKRIKKRLCLSLLEGNWKTMRRISSDQMIYSPSVRSLLVFLFRLGFVERKKIKVPSSSRKGHTHKIFTYKLKENVSETQLFEGLGLK